MDRTQVDRRLIEAALLIVLWLAVLIGLPWHAMVRANRQAAERAKAAGHQQP